MEEDAKLGNCELEQVCSLLCKDSYLVIWIIQAHYRRLGEKKGDEDHKKNVNK